MSTHRTDDEGAALAVPFALRLERAALHLDMSRAQFYLEKEREGFPAPVFYAGIRRWIVRELEEWALQHRVDVQPAPVSARVPPRRGRAVTTT